RRRHHREPAPSAAQRHFRRHRTRYLAGSAYLRTSAETRQRLRGRNATHLQYGTRNAHRGSRQEIQESADAAGARRRKILQRRPHRQGRPQGNVQLGGASSSWLLALSYPFYELSSRAKRGVTKLAFDFLRVSVPPW